MKIKEEYENGLLNGTRLVYYQNGEKQVDETYQFWMVTGLVKNYYRGWQAPFGKLLPGKSPARPLYKLLSQW